MFPRALLLALAAAGTTLGTAHAADFWTAAAPAPAMDVYSSPLFDFQGFYAGGSLGGYLGDDAGLAVGVVAGSNLAVNDLIYAGLEFQGGGVFTEDWTFDAYGLLHAGVLVMDGLMVYGAGGVGWEGGDFNYAIGGGAEYAIMDPLTVRGEVLGIGEWGHGFDSAKVTASALWHFN